MSMVSTPREQGSKFIGIAMDPSLPSPQVGAKSFLFPQTTFEDSPYLYSKYGWQNFQKEVKQYKKAVAEFSLAFKKVKSQSNEFFES